MFSRIKYISYPSFIRKKMVARDKEQRRKKLKKSKGKIVIAVAVLLLLALAATVTVIWLKGRNKARSGVSLDIENVVIGDGSSPVIRDSGKSVIYKGNTYNFNENVVSFALIGIDKETMGLDYGVVGTGGQSDTIAVLAYDTETGKSKIVVIPRETMTEVSTYSANGSYLDIQNMQICLAYAYGDGKELSCRNAISSIDRLLFGIQINHFVALDLDGIVALNDAVGGVELTCIETIGQFTEGERVNLIGDMADKYVRDRRMDRVDADSARRARQKQYIEEFVSKTMKMAKKDLSLIPRLWSFASDYMISDLSADDVVYLSGVALIRNFELGDFTTVPGEYRMGERYAEYHADETALFELVLDTFYTKQ